MLKVNLELPRAHCLTDEHVKAVVCHEFLHVVLRHTESGRGPFTAARHLALDAAINAIIHRQFGDAYSSMMKTYYRDAQDLKKMLRPMNLDEKALADALSSAWKGASAMGARLGRPLRREARRRRHRGGRGGPEGTGRRLAARLPLRASGRDRGPARRSRGARRALPEALRRAVDAALRQMNGAGIWRSPRERGVGANPYEALFMARNEPMRRWERRTLQVLRRHLTPDRNSRRARPEPDGIPYPGALAGRPAGVRAGPCGRRSCLRPVAVGAAARQGHGPGLPGRFGIDGPDMQAVIALLARLSRYIRRPFWAFSDVVVPAVIESGGLLKTRTTGGTSMTCVLEHVAKTRPEAAVVLTDGYIERVDAEAPPESEGLRACTCS